METDGGSEEQLAAADGPRVRLALPDGQELLAVVRRRRHEPAAGDGGWWYLLEVPLWGAARLSGGRVLAEPVPVECWAPAHVCTPVPGEDYASVPTDRPARAPGWQLEFPADAVGVAGRAVIHRGDCAAAAGLVRPAGVGMARRAARGGAALCAVCRPSGLA